MQVFFRTVSGRTVPVQLLEAFTLDDFVEAASRASGFRSRDETLSFRYTSGSKPLNVNNAEEFARQSQYINDGSNIFVMGRLLGGGTLPDTLQAIVEQELDGELEKVVTRSTDCTICLDSEMDCVKVCCIWVCTEDFKRWLLEKQFKMSCMLCCKAVSLKAIFKTPEYIATLHALQDEKLLLRNLDCQRCLDCNALMHNETLTSRQTCVSCRRQFCFFCNRKWNVATMVDTKNTCGKECVYETMLSFELIPFHYDQTMMIPNRRTCPKCFNFGDYDRKCKYHSCIECKYTFCFLCLEEESECKRKYKSSYSHRCIQEPVLQTYSMFPLLMS